MGPSKVGQSKIPRRPEAGTPFQGQEGSGGRAWPWSGWSRMRGGSGEERVGGGGVVVTEDGSRKGGDWCGPSRGDHQELVWGGGLTPQACSILIPLSD